MEINDSWVRQNSFTFLRLLLAMTVVIGHASALGGFAGDPIARWTYGRASLGSLAVCGFFALSGFLLTHSWTVSPALDRFFLHRFFRIMPAFWASLLVTVFVLAPLILMTQIGEAPGYWESLATGPNSALDYLCHNWLLTLQQFGICTLFAANPHPFAVNGSLWTLAYEGLCYLCLMLAAVSGWLRRRHFTLALFLFVYGTRIIDIHLVTSLREMAPVTMQCIPILNDPTGLPLYLAFLSGMVCYQYRMLLPWRLPWLIGASFFAVVVTAFGYVELAWPPTLAFILLYFGRILPFQRWEKLGDFSYGIYIYAFPIQQCLALADVQCYGRAAFTIASLASSVIAGLLSWHLLEKHAIGWGRSIARRLRTGALKSGEGIGTKILPPIHRQVSS